MSGGKETKEKKEGKTFDHKRIQAIGLLCGICILSLGLMSSFDNLSTKDDSKETLSEISQQTDETLKDNDLESKLKNILSQINGAGEVDVMITLDSSEEIKPAYNIDSTNEKSSEKDKNGGERTVTTSSENKTLITSSSNEPIVITTKEPIIKGVIVVSSGADDSVVKETLYKAVQTALQVKGHQVEIFDK